MSTIKSNDEYYFAQFGDIQGLIEYIQLFVFQKQYKKASKKIKIPLNPIYHHPFEYNASFSCHSSKKIFQMAHLFMDFGRCKCFIKTYPKTGWKTLEVSQNKAQKQGDFHLLTEFIRKIGGF